LGKRVDLKLACKPFQDVSGTAFCLWALKMVWRQIDYIAKFVSNALHLRNIV
jgi:hypothetical protein